MNQEYKISTYIETTVSTHSYIFKIESNETNRSSTK